METKKGAWNVHLRKSGSKVKISYVNPQGGSESGTDSRSFKSALNLVKYKASQGHGISKADKVWVTQSVWDRASGDYKQKKAGWVKLNESLEEAVEPNSEVLKELADRMRKYPNTVKVKTSATRVTLMVQDSKSKLQKVLLSHQSSGKVGIMWWYSPRERTKSNMKPDIDKIVSRILQEIRSAKL